MLHWEDPLKAPDDVELQFNDCCFDEYFPVTILENQQKQRKNHSFQTIGSGRQL